MDKSIHTPQYRILLELLRQQRQQAGLTQEELAAKIDENQVFVSRYERGESRLDVLQLQCICEAAGVSLSTFIRRFERELGKG